jgi:L-fuculose-phosphate aldolase
VGGNLSLRVDENLILITPTKTMKRIMRFEDICAVDLVGQTIFAPDGKKPTGETPFHTRILRKRHDLKAVVHAHPPYMTGFAIANSDLLSKPYLPEPAIEAGPILTVPYETPISEALSEKFDLVIDRSNAFLMENHGAVVCSPRGITDAVEIFQMYECMAQSVFVAYVLGNAKPIAANKMNGMNEVISTRNLPIPGKPGLFKSTSALYGLL